MRTLVLAGKMGPAFTTASIEMPHPIIGVQIMRVDKSDDVVFRDYADGVSDVDTYVEGWDLADMTYDMAMSQPWD